MLGRLDGKSLLPARSWQLKSGYAFTRHVFMKSHNFSSQPKGDRTTRRRFLKQTAGLAAGAAVLERIIPSCAAAPAEPLLPTIRLGPHAVTRLIIGGNPIYGFSHFNKLFGEHQKAWHTPEHVVELLQHCEVKGLNTWQISYHERSVADLARY